jgi:hypothetical protein
MGKRVVDGWGFGTWVGCLGTWVLVSVPAVVGMRHGVPACERWGWVGRKPGRLEVRAVVAGDGPRARSASGGKNQPRFESVD